ncbi:hypothetical protein [Pseudoramibacter alactolyticus]|nr:hypothetical protein [Pseudoramibacter alactolyticus]
MNDLEEKIYQDIQSEIDKYYDQEGIKYTDKEKAEDRIINFFHIYLDELL